MIPVFKPSYTKEEIAAVTKTIKSCWWGAGPQVEKFEEEFKNYIGTKHAVALNSGTAALHLAIKALNLPKNSEIIVPAITFISTAFAPLYNGHKVVFADVDELTMNIDLNDAKKKITKNTKAIIPVHYGGYSCDMDELEYLRDRYDLFIIEDAAHAAGAKYGKRKIGTVGDISCFSFHAVKNMSTGDGGMAVTDNKEYADKIRKLRWLGIDKETHKRTNKDQYSWEYLIDDVGYKFQMNDIMASLGRVQLKRLDTMNKKRRSLTKIYNEAFENVSWIKVPWEKENCYSSCHNYVIKVRKDRNKLMEYLKEKGISTGVHYLPLYKHPVFKGANAKCPGAERVWKKIITLPLYPDMTKKQQDYVIKSVSGFK